MLWKRYIDHFLHLFFPRLCAACEAILLSHEEMLCTSCLFHLPFTDFHLFDDNDTARQLWGKVSFERAFSMFELSKSSRVETLLHKLKYKNQPEIGIYLGRLYASSIAGYVGEVDLIAPIPLHRSKLRKRGYNQAAKFGEGLSQGLGIPLKEDLLIRVLASESQTKRSRIDRYDNVKNAFVLNPYVTIQDLHILLVDDVLTTGATMSEAALTLVEAGAKVSIATIARA